MMSQGFIPLSSIVMGDGYAGCYDWEEKCCDGGAFATKDVSEYTVCGGVLAELIKKRDWRVRIGQFV